MSSAMVGRAVATIVPSIELITCPSWRPMKITSVWRNVSGPVPRADGGLHRSRSTPPLRRARRERVLQSGAWPGWTSRDSRCASAGCTALDGVDLDVAGGAATGLIGPNGAGKTTLFDAVCGLQGIDRGRILLDGTDITRVKPSKRARMGIARTFQRLELFGSMSARDNIRVAAEVHRSYTRRAGGERSTDARCPGRGDPRPGRPASRRRRAGRRAADRPGSAGGGRSGAGRTADAAAARRAVLRAERGRDRRVRSAPRRPRRRGSGHPARGARRRAGDARVPPHPRPRLREGDRRRLARPRCRATSSCAPRTSAPPPA